MRNNVPQSELKYTDRKRGTLIESPNQYLEYKTEKVFTCDEDNQCLVLIGDMLENKIKKFLFFPSVVGMKKLMCNIHHNDIWSCRY